MMQKDSGAETRAIHRQPDFSDVVNKSSSPCPTPLVDSLKASIDQVRGPEDGDFSRDGSADSSLGKRKNREPEPESPGRNDPAEPIPTGPPFLKKERVYYDEMGQDSPASYPKHVMVPSAEEQTAEHHDVKDQYTHNKEHSTAPLLTPDSISQRRQASFEAPVYARQQSYHDSYRAPSYTDVDCPRASFSGSMSEHPRVSHGESHTRTRRWACDFCNVATFLSYEEACAHEEECARLHGAVAPSSHQQYHGGTSYGPPPPPPPPHGMPLPPPHQQGTGLGALYHASQEVVTPPTPQRHFGSRWGSRGPPLPVLPHEHNYYQHGYYDQREDPAYYNRQDPYYGHQYQNYGYPPQGHYAQPAHVQSYQKRMRLCMPNDSESLSDRQCYVRSEMCEIFAATDRDVAARHSKGAQKLVLGQVGIRCIHCAHLRPRDRAERAVCYPSSISRIYQTVADMQRFHFEHCKEIPKHVAQVYKNLKTTRPRGVGSPQTYWVQSAKALGLADTENGIRFEADMPQESQPARYSGHVEAVTDGR